MGLHDGQLRVRPLGLPHGFRADVYHRLMSLSWPRLLALFITIFLAFNLVFAGLYRLDPGGLVVARDDAGLSTFWRDFYFSVHTVATIGYGNIYPADTYANTMVVVEITLGIVYFALATGIAFARFSRPTARLVFSRVMIVREVDGVPMLMLRAANQRHNMLYSAEARLSVMVDSEVGGVRMRRWVDLKLARSNNPAFALTWMIMHPIDEDSPLRSWLEDRGNADGGEIIVILSGTDEISGQTVHARWAYGAEDLRWGARFHDIVGFDDKGWRTIDYALFHEVIESEGENDVQA